jgi:bacterioferritin
LKRDERCLNVFAAQREDREEQLMRGDKAVIDHLNVVLKNELTAVNQYFLHARILRHWGVTKLGDHEYDESIDEMKHADMVIERILFLGGMPRLVLDKLLIGESVQQVLECDLALEQQAMPQLREAIAHSEHVQDFVSRDLFAAILKAEEEHVDFLETQLELIPKIGIENYIQLQSGPAGPPH